MTPKLLGCFAARVAKVAALSSILSFNSLAHGADIVKWGPGTDIVTADTNITVGKGTQALSLSAYSSPSVGSSYYPNNSGATPRFYAASYGFVKSTSNPAGATASVGNWKVDHDAAGDRLFVNVNGPTDSTEATVHHLYLWQKSDFIGAAATATSVSLDGASVTLSDNGTATTSLLRFVVRLNTSYYVSSEFGEGTQSFSNPASLTWRSYNPESDFTNVSGAIVSLSASDFAQVNRVGIYTKAVAPRYAQSWITALSVSGTAQSFTLKDIVSGLPQNQNIGRMSTNTLKIPGVNALPSGASKSGNKIYVNGDNVVLEDWNFEGHTLIFHGDNCTVVNCVLGEASGPAGLTYIVDIYADAHDLLIEHNDFIGYDGEGGAGAIITQRISGSGLSVTAGSNLTIRCNKFVNSASDSIKTAGNGAVIEWNAFLDPVNLREVPYAWSSTKVYDTGDYALNSNGNIFKSKIDGNVNHAVPSSKTSNTYWLSYDPHVDHITVIAAPGYLTIQYNYFSRADKSRKVQGMNNVVRFVRNTGTDHLVEDCLYLCNYIEANSDVPSMPMQISDGGQPNYVGPVALRHSWWGQNSGASYIYNPVSIDDCIWDSNKDSVSGASIAAPSGCSTETTAAPSVSVVPAEILSGHQ